MSSDAELDGVVPILQGLIKRIRASPTAAEVDYMRQSQVKDLKKYFDALSSGQPDHDVYDVLLDDLRTRFDPSRKAKAEVDRRAAALADSKAQLAGAKEALSHALAAIEEKEKDIRSVKDKRERRQALQGQMESNTRLLDEARSTIATAKGYMADFPTDTQVLKLERRLEALKEQVKQLEHVEHQHIAGIEAYKQRRQQNREARATLVAGCADLTGTIGALCDSSLQEDAAIVSTDAARDACDVMCTISGTRELSLQEASKASDATADEAATLSKAISELQLRSEREIPLVEAEKDKDMAEISDEWGKEKDTLQAVYDRLFVLNKEQSFHLQRGTHIKRETLVASESEKTLSSRHARIANEIVETTAKLHDATEDYAHVKKQSEQLRTIARSARAEYDGIRQAKEAQLAKARDAVQVVVDEANTLRNLKGEIYQALQCVRDAPYVAITPRTTRR